MRLDPPYSEVALNFLAEAQAAAGRFDAAVATLLRWFERRLEGLLMAGVPELCGVRLEARLRPGAVSDST